MTCSDPNTGQTAATPAASVTFNPGALPRDPAHVVDLPAVTSVRRTVQAALHFGKFGLVIGSPGLSKTTSSVLAVRNCGLAAKYTIMSGASSASARAAVAAIYESLTGTEPSGRSSTVIRDVANILLTDQYVLVVDETDYISTAGLRTITSVWNAVHTARGRGTPIILIGTKKAPISRHVPELASRVISTCTVKPLRKQEARQALVHLYARFAATPPNIIDLAAKPFAGSIRNLADVCDILRLLSPATPEDQPVTEQEVVNAHATMGVHATTAASNA